jgi:tetratricopeptide (TPR) repeat protein
MNPLPSCVFAVACLLAPASSGLAPTPRQEPVPSKTEVPKLETVALQVQHAAKLKAALRGFRDGERKSREAAVVAAYRAVRRHFPEAAEACAESAFRAGELLRASGDSAGARAEFRYVRDRAPRTAFHARAGIELGHLARKSRQPSEALDLYLAVADDPKSEPARRDEAALWAGRVYAEQQQPDEARRRWEGVAQRAEDPLQRIDAWDELALALVDAGDLEGAAGWIARARETLADAALEETAQGERVRGALERMRAIRRLERAVAERDAAKPATPVR